jgi:hypothetical protein
VGYWIKKSIIIPGKGQKANVSIHVLRYADSAIDSQSNRWTPIPNSFLLCELSAQSIHVEHFAFKK